MLILPLLILMQVLPPPLGLVVTARLFGPASHADAVLAVPMPGAPATAAEDCDCGVPANPRGPR